MTKLDNELAAAADALMERRVMPPLSDENRELGEVLRQLYDTIEPDQAPSAAFEQRLAARLSSDWDQRAQNGGFLRLLDQPAVRVLALAAAVVLVLGAVLVLAVPESPQPLQGAAINLDDAAALIVLVGVIGAAAVVYWRRRR